ncbi:MAG: hypothetical protein EXR77_07235 [Myxococcales bacterium]|nr:hypothetical protein [Myxococcales bacterium]
MVAGSSACSMATLGSAKPVDVGETQFVVAPAFSRIGLAKSARPGAQFEVGGRHGLTENVDIGARLWLPMPGYTLDSRIALKKAQAADKGLDVSLNPGLMYIYAPGGDTNASPLHFATIQLAVLFGIHMAGGKQLVIGPKLTDILSADTSTEFGSTFNMLIAGTSVGYVWPITRNFTLVPEVSVGMAVLGAVTGFGSDLGNNGNVLQFSLGMLFGGTKGPELRCVEVPVVPAAAVVPAEATSPTTTP